jgi:hypothetical protein
MAEGLSREESEHNSFYSFHNVVELLSLPAEETSKISGHYNTAWEIKCDITGHPISYLAEATFLGITPAQINAIETLSKMVAALPEDATSPKGTNTRTVEGDITSMKHPAWDPVRAYAVVVIEILKPIAIRNQAYFERLRT